MIISLFAELGAWSWMILGLILLILEIIASGTFLLWFGVAAMVVGLLSFVLDGVAFWTLQVQMITFVVISIVFVFVGKRMMAKNKSGKSENELLNQRSKQMIGREAVLIEAITQGMGRISLGDTIWRVTGEDAPIGAKVKIIGQSAGTVLIVEAL